MRTILWSDPLKRLWFGAAMVLLTMATEVVTLARQPAPAPVPEISGASLSAGMALLGAGVLWLRSRRSK